MNYKSVKSLKEWYNHASIRKVPQRKLQTADTPLDYFSRKLYPVVNHEEISSLGNGITRKLLIRKLYYYLAFTAYLEQEIVNYALNIIATKKDRFELPMEMRLDAYKIYCDEAFHALFSADIIHQIEEETGILNHEYKPYQFEIAIKKELKNSNKEFWDLTYLFAVIVSETLISATLSEIVKDAHIVPVVREIIRDHAVDEGYHHIFFIQVLNFIWPQMSLSDKNQIAPIVPKFILAFLSPDYNFIRTELKQLGFTKRQIEKIMAESYKQEDVNASIIKSSRKTVQYFYKADGRDESVLENEFILSGFPDKTMF